ncbi:DUF4214 domain-containing protein [Chelatococcus asaccharovorans]|uniref:DUF4214 domain-containing protein n=1 Tax=Chelatococcus asaccharovorans TaxID=28210 RepID=UPI00224C6F3A|nr:DUF4214 domain-containing protein [Chelatococcus asaccharovorans]CAH1658527.1 conserved hypothetical protein [Chelatococcus asaccharovorans]CAH1688577.1 conserved hypothetical protein [Chelatococcus asaccharovorans]
MIKLEVDHVTATWSDDILSCNTPYTVTYGAGGNDRLSTSAKAPFVILSGGSGDDRYVMSRGSHAILADWAGGRDTLEMEGADYARVARTLATIDNGRHLFLRDDDSSVIILDYRSDANRLEEFKFGSATVPLEALQQHAQSQATLDFRWEELFAQGLTPVPKDTIDLAITSLSDRSRIVEQSDDAQGIARMYETAFHRRADLDGLNHWWKFYERDQDKEILARAFLASPEFTARLSGTDGSARACVDIFFDGFSPPGSHEARRATVAHAIESGQMSREAALLSVSDYAENVERCAYVNDLIYRDGLWSFG